MEKYLETLLSQIRCKKARPYIEAEIKGHIECQIEDNMSAGLSFEEAEKNAIEDMGDPVEVGVSLDRIHKPQVAWSMVVLVGMISIVGVMLHYFIGKEIMELIPLGQIHPLTARSNGNYFGGVLFGLVAMAVVYWIDYSVIAKYSRIIGTILLALGIFGTIFGYTVNGVSQLGIGGIQLTTLLMLYVPIYGAIIYKYRNTKWKGLILSILWLLAPVFIAFRMNNLYLAFVLYISMFSMLIIAVVDGWFLLPKKKSIFLLSVALVFSQVIGLVILYLSDLLLSDYQKARIHAFMHPGFDGNGVGYMSANLRNQHMNSVLIGGDGKEILSSGNNYTSDFILTYITGSYGKLAGMIVCVAMAVLITTVFVAMTKQKNRVGMLMGCGCGILLLVNGGINVLENLGYFPLSQTFMPFLSCGTNNIVLSYMLVGLVMSIYRYKNVYPKHLYVNHKLTNG